MLAVNITKMSQINLLLSFVFWS